MKPLFSLLFLAFLLSCGPTPDPKTTNSAQLILLNGRFFTADSTSGTVTAIAIANERILALGTDESMRKLADENTKIIDLQGNFAMPGFIEGHGHFHGLGQSLQNLNLMQTESWAEITGMVAEKAKTTPPGEWIEGRGWHQEKWTESAGATVNGYPYHNDLSAVSTKHPVLLYHASGHGLIANAKAIELAGISRETPDPMEGRIVRDVKGNMTGVFEENAMELIEKPFQAWKNLRSEAEKSAAFEKTTALAAAACLEKGITSFQDAGSPFWDLAEYRRLAEAGQHRIPVEKSQPLVDAPCLDALLRQTSIVGTGFQ